MNTDVYCATSSYRYLVSNFMSQTSSRTTFSTLWQYCLSALVQVSTGSYVQTNLSWISHTGWMLFFSHWSQISLGCSLQSLVYLYFFAFLGRVFISSSQIFFGSKWQFCSSTGKGKMLENFSQYL